MEAALHLQAGHRTTTAVVRYTVDADSLQECRGTVVNWDDWDWDDWDAKETMVMPKSVGMTRQPAVRENF
jgi:hypothetical protein